MPIDNQQPITQPAPVAGEAAETRASFEQPVSR